MRMIGTIENRQLAEKFGNYLYLNKIPNRVEDEEGGSYSVWVFDDDNIPTATDLMHRYLKDPQQSEFQGVTEQAQILKIKERIQDRLNRSRTIDMRTHWHRYDRRIGPLTAVLIGISVVVALISGLGHNANILEPFFITKYVVDGTFMTYHTGLLEIRDGQIWRLVTPVFIHFGILHLLFNMMWLKDLGTIIEQRQGTWFLGVFVLVVAILSNLGQFFWAGPNFGGMSGVVYGLLGYMWIRGRYDPASGLSLNPTVVTMMIVWFLLCLTGLVGHVANAAHGAGLAAGMIWGFISAKLRR